MYPVISIIFSFSLSIFLSFFAMGRPGNLFVRSCLASLYTSSFCSLSPTSSICFVLSLHATPLYHSHPECPYVYA